MHFIFFQSNGQDFMQPHKLGSQVLPCILYICTLHPHAPYDLLFQLFNMKLYVITSGVLVSLAMGIKFLIPFIFQIWSIVLPWLSPPYLYIIMNCIIIAIAASSRFHKIASSPSPESDSFPVQSEIITTVSEPPPLLYEGGDDKIVEVKPVLLNGAKVEEQETDADADIEPEDEDEEGISISTYTPPQKNTPPVPEVRPDFLLPATLGHWKPLRANRKGPCAINAS